MTFSDIAVRPPFVRFELERWMSAFEHSVTFNLCDSGVDPLTLEELFATARQAGLEADIGTLGSTTLGYGQANGSDATRSAIARLYPGATPENVLVTTGSAEALFILCWALIGPGDRIVVPTPSYFQVTGLATNAGAEVVKLPLTLEDSWTPDAGALDRYITSDTKLVVVTNPHNPTGRRLPEELCAQILARVAEVGAWLIADEVYHGMEFRGDPSSTMWGRYERTIVTNSLSKSYGLPGLRLGWIVAPPDIIANVWPRHDYTVLTPNPLADRCGVLAIDARETLQHRARAILRRNWPRLEERLTHINRRTGERLAWQAPEAGGICFVRCDSKQSTLEIAERLRRDHSVLVAPGEHFEAPGFLRIGIGGNPDQYQHGLDALEAGLLAALT